LENAYLEMFGRWLKKQNGQLPVTPQNMKRQTD
jgi:hypothetical protein